MALLLGDELNRRRGYADACGGTAVCVSRFVAAARMADMEEKPPSRWFRFKLSTWLVLLALLPAYAGGVVKSLGTVAIGGSRNLTRGPIDEGWLTVILAVFLVWKTAWAFGPRIVRRRESAMPK